MKNKVIVWEKWVDPLNTNIDEVEYPGYIEPNEDKNYEFLSTDPDFESKMSPEQEEEYAENDKHIIYNPTRIVSTPHGFVSLTEHSFASKHFDFWTMHYNRDITEQILNAVEKCPGVETVNVISRYRIRIGFNRILNQANGFNLTEIKQGVEKAVRAGGGSEAQSQHNNYDEKISHFPDGVKKEIENIIQNHFSDKDNWLIYVLPNGKIEYIDLNSSDPDLALEKAILFSETKRLVGGNIIESA